MQLLVQLLVTGADPAPSSISSPVGQEDQGGGTQRQDCRDSRTAVLGTATLVPMPPLLPTGNLGSDPQQAVAHGEGLTPHLLITAGPGGSDGAFPEQGVQKANTFPVHLQVAQGMPPFWITSSYVLWPGSMSRACHPACRVLYNLQRFLSPQSWSKNQLLSAPMLCKQPLPPEPHRSSGGEAEAGRSAGAGSCQHPLPSPERSFKMGTESCSPHQEFLNQTIFSLTAPRLERETWQLPAGREEGTPLAMPAALGPEESGVSVLQPFAQQRLKPR